MLKDLTQSRVARSIWVLMSGRTAILIMSFVSLSVLARLLTPADYGVLASASVVLALNNTLFDGAVGLSLIVRKDVTPLEISGAFAKSLSLSVLMCALALAVSPFLDRLTGVHGSGVVLAAMTVVTPLKAVSAVSASLLQRAGRFSALSGALFVSYPVGYLVVGPALAWAGFGVWALVLAALTSQMVETILMVLLSPLPAPSFKKDAGQGADGEQGYILLQFANYVANVSGNIAVGRSLGVVALGHYSRAWRLMDIGVSLLGAPLQKVFFSHFAANNENRYEKLRTYVRAVETLTPAFFLVSMLAGLHAPMAVRLLLGDGWRQTETIASILLTTLAFRCLPKVHDALPSSEQRTGVLTAFQVVYAVMMLCGAILGARWGVTGVAGGTSIAIAAHYALSVGYAAHIADRPFSWVFTLHTYSVLVCVFAYFADLGTMRLFPNANFFAMHFGGGTVGLAVGGIVLLTTYQLAGKTGRWSAPPAATAAN